jgi:hypothetical protein
MILSIELRLSHKEPDLLGRKGAADVLAGIGSQRLMKGKTRFQVTATIITIFVSDHYSDTVVTTTMVIAYVVDVNQNCCLISRTRTNYSLTITGLKNQLLNYSCLGTLPAH